MPQFRILIAVNVVTDDFQTASVSAQEFLTRVKGGYGRLGVDARVLKIEDVSPPSLAVPDLANTGD